MEYTSSSEHSDKDREEDPFAKDNKYDFEKFQKTKWVTGEMGPFFKRELFLLVHARATTIYIVFVICVTVGALGVVDDKMFFMSQSLRDHLKEQAGHQSPTLNETSEVKFEDITTVEEMWDFILNHLIKYLHAQQYPGALPLSLDENSTENNITTQLDLAAQEPPQQPPQQPPKRRTKQPPQDSASQQPPQDSASQQPPQDSAAQPPQDSAAQPPQDSAAQQPPQDSAAQQPPQDSAAQQPVPGQKRKRQVNITKPEENLENANDTHGDYMDIEFLFDRGLGYENILVGPAVIRSVMVIDYECPKPFASVFIRCYPPYSLTDVKEETSEGYNYQLAEETKAESFSGKVSYYDGGGYQIKLGPTYKDTKNITEILKHERFITKGTRAVFIDATYYNPSINLFCAVKFLFELPAGGGVVSSAYFYTMKLTRVSIRDYITVGFQITFMIFIIFYIIEDIRTILFIKMEYFNSFWNWINIAIYTTSILYLYYFYTQMAGMYDVIQTMKKDMTDYISFQTITKYELIMRNYLAMVIFLVYFKIFKYLSFNWTMTILNKTIEKCLDDVFAFALMFLVMFIAFALFGSLCFGNQIRHFSTVPLAMFTLLRTMLGDFDYKEFEDADKYVAQLFYLLYIFSVFLILLNLFLAIINDTYSDAKTELAIAAPERRVSDYWNTGLYNLMVAVGCKKCAPKALVTGSRVNPSAQEIRAALKRVGYTDLDINLFLSRYNVDPDSQVRVKDVSKLMDHLKVNVPNRYLPKKHASKDINPPPIVALDDFSEQQKRLVILEDMMGSLADKLDVLLNKLGTIKDPEKDTSSDTTM